MPQLEGGVLVPQKCPIVILWLGSSTKGFENTKIIDYKRWKKKKTILLYLILIIMCPTFVKCLLAIIFYDIELNKSK